MRILIVAELAYPSIGGQEIRFKDLSESWVKQGHEVTVVTIDHLGDLPSDEVINGVLYKRIISESKYYKGGVLGRKISTIFSFTYKVLPFLKQNWDVMVFGQFPLLPIMANKILSKKGIPKILDFVEFRSSLPWKIINKLIWSSADKIICISKPVMELVQKNTNKQAFTIPSLVNVKECKSIDKKDYVFLGRLVEHKHPDFAIEAVLHYNKKYNKNVRLNLMGGGEMLPKLKELYGNEENIVLHGRVSDQIKGEILSQGRIFLLPSEREGLPMSVVEAMAYGIPTITTKYDGNGTQYFVSEEKIGLVSKPDLEEFADTIMKLESDYQKFVDNCLCVAPNHDLSKMSAKYLEIVFDEALIN